MCLPKKSDTVRIALRETTSSLLVSTVMILLSILEMEG